MKFWSEAGIWISSHSSAIQAGAEFRLLSGLAKKIETLEKRFHPGGPFSTLTFYRDEPDDGWE